jgi:(E)-4-hydroxy-3-methylbut-2-enyl-diphosphate synthase
MAKLVDYPFHIGITEAGPKGRGIIKSAIGIGTLLLKGIGDTIRVSLTAPPVEEIRAGYGILTSLGLRGGVDLVSCPTCGRCEVDLVRLVDEVEKRLSHPQYRVHLKVAIMGCVVNGPGEAREADIGVAFGKGVGLLFKKGKPYMKVREEEAVDALMDEVRGYGG